MKNLLRSEKGSALIYVLLVMVVLSVLGMSALSVSLSNTKFSIRDEQKLNAYYIAKAGIDSVSQNFIDKPAEVLPLIDDVNGITGSFGDGTYVVKVSHATDGIKLVSTGKINGTSVSDTIALGMASISNAAGIFNSIIYSDSNTTLDLSSMSKDTITGDLRARGPIKKPAGYDSTSYKTYPNVGIPHDPVIVPDLGTIKTYSGNEIDSGGYYGDVDVSKNTTLKLDASGGPLTLVVDSIVCNGAIEIITDATGKGTVFIFVKKSFYIGKNNNDKDSNGFVNQVTGSSSSNLNVFLVGDSISDKIDFEIKGGIFNGYLYAPTANIELHNKAQFTGAMITGSYTKKTGSDKNYVTFEVPDADLSYSGIITGKYIRVNYSNK